MTVTLAELLAGEDMEGGENFCDSVYNFLKNQGKDINLLANSGFGVWSQSDANKGLGTLVYDNIGVAVFVVGEAITTAGPPVGSGATGKVITDIAGTLTLGACTGRFNDNEQITGATSGTTADVNMPDVAVGVDLVRNGEFEAGVGGWTASQCALAFVAGGQVGNCLRLTRTAGVSQYAHQVLTLEVGKIYKWSIYIKSGTSGNEAFKLGVIDNAEAVWLTLIEGTSGGAWVKYSGAFEATETDSRIICVKNTDTVGTMFFDEISLYEITPCCTNDADNLAFDGWYKDLTIDIYRQHWHATYGKCGSFYSLKMVPTLADDYVVFPLFTDVSDAEYWYKQFCGRAVTIGAWVLTNTANHAHVYIGDDVSGAQYSDYHTGGGDWEWLELTFVIDEAATRVLFGFYSAVAGDVDGTTIVYVSQPMLVFGWSLGEGMYQPKTQEVIFLEKVRYSNSLYADGFSDVAWADLNVEADSDALLPKGCRALQMALNCRDSASFANTVYMTFRGDATMVDGVTAIAGGKGDDIQEVQTPWVRCGAGGDLRYRLEASGDGTLAVYLAYHAVQVN